MIDQTLIEQRGVRDISLLELSLSFGVGANRLEKALDPFAKKFVNKLGKGWLNGRGDFGQNGVFAGGFKNKWWYDYRNTSSAVKNILVDPVLSNSSFLTNQFFNNFDWSSFRSNKPDVIQLPEIILTSGDPNNVNKVKNHIENNR